MRKEHVRIEDGETMVFDYPAKCGQRRVQGLVDPEALEVVAKLRRRRGGGDELLAYKRGRTGTTSAPTTSTTTSRQATGDDFSAKDFRTWSATVLCAVALAVSGEAAATETGRKRAITARRQGGRRTTWATRPRSAAPPTSTRACSTPTKAAW